MKLPEIDWDRIHAILNRADELHDSGKLDCATWVALVRDFGEAGRGQLPLPGHLGRMAKEGWFEVFTVAPRNV
jgi:hypothetical protein